MTQPIATVDRRYYTPPEYFLKPRKETYMGRVVTWIRSSEKQSAFPRAIFHTLVFFASLALLLSLVGIPIFLYGYREYLIQEDRSGFSKIAKTAHNAWTDYANYVRVERRRKLLDHIHDITLTGKTRRQIIQDFEIPEGDTPKDVDLVKIAANARDDFLPCYHLEIVSR